MIKRKMSQRKRHGQKNFLVKYLLEIFHNIENAKDKMFAPIQTGVSSLPRHRKEALSELSCRMRRLQGTVNFSLSLLRSQCTVSSYTIIVMILHYPVKQGFPVE